MEDIFSDILDFVIFIARAVLKILSGVIIIPLGIAVDQLKPGWEEASTTVKFFTGILLLPITAFLLFAAPWWNDFDVVD